MVRSSVSSKKEVANIKQAVIEADQAHKQDYEKECRPIYYKVKRIG
ncbi:hypothetical protein GCM10020331_007520 [Ectobacillus funiculus]